MAPKDITSVAIRLTEDYGFEFSDFKWLNDREPDSGELISSGFCELFELFISYGLDPNQIDYDENGTYFNVMEALFSYDNFDVSLPILKRLLEIGGNPNLRLEKYETLFEKVDFDIVFGAIEQENRERYEVWVKFWLLLFAYGGKFTVGAAIQMKNGYTSDIFKEYDRISFRIDFVKPDWIMHMFDKQSGEEVAVF